MAYPSIDDRDYSYTAFQTSQGDNSFPGTELDNDLDNVWTFLGSTNDFLAVSFASDGTLKPGSVTRDALAADIVAGLAAPTVWETATAYAVDDTVTTDNKLYVCATAHTSGTFATDLAAAKWTLVASWEPLSSVSDDSISTAKLQDSAVTTAKIADSNVTTAKIADSNVTRAKLATDAGSMPYGAVIPYAGVFPPIGWIFCDGQNASRSTYPDLFNTLAPVAVATVTNTSNTLTALDTDFTAYGVIGAVVEGSGIPAGTTITAVTSTTITMSAAATSTGAGRSVRVLPFGAGDNSTTFGLPDLRGRVPAGRDDMNGTAASRLTSTTVDGTKLGQGGGAQTHALSSGENGSHTHSVTDAGHTHGVTDPGHTHTIAYTAGASAAVGNNTLGGASSTNTGSNTTGISIASGTTGVSVASSGSGTAHNNVQPTGVVNYIIFAGV